MSAKNGQTHAEHLIDLFKKAGEKGLTKEEATKKLKTRASNIFVLIHLLRKKGHIIKTAGDRYIYTGFNTDKAQVVKVAYKRTALKADAVIESLFKQGAVKELSVATLAKEMIKMEPSDRRDCLDMYKKALFYHLSTEAFIKASKAAGDLLQQVQGTHA